MASATSQAVHVDENHTNSQQFPANKTLSKIVTTTTTTVSTTTKKRDDARNGRKQAQTDAEAYAANRGGSSMSVARVEDLGRQASLDASPMRSMSQATTRRLESGRVGSQGVNEQQREVSRVSALDEGEGSDEGNSRVTTISTIAAQSGKGRIVLAILKDGIGLKLKVQEMRPSIFEVGASYKDCLKYLDEHQKLVRNLRKQKQKPIEEWWRKYQKICAEEEPRMTAERKLVYMCMAENLAGCWKALLGQLDQRTNLLSETCEFYESAEQLSQALDRADSHVQVFRQEFLNGPEGGSMRFQQACHELKALNDSALDRYHYARKRQQALVELVATIGTGNLDDSRVNLLIPDARDLINYINNYLDPLDRRRIQLESVISTTKTTTIYDSLAKQQINKSRYHEHQSEQTNGSNVKTTTTSVLREITNFNDLDLVENWLSVKMEQLNSSLLSSLGASVSDSRSILGKHEQIALECRAIEEATLTFNGKNIHAIKSLDPKDDKLGQDNESLFERQKLLAQRARDVITVLEARIVLLRRAIDFYLRSKEATNDVNRMLRRLQVDNSLQSVQFVSNELELKDVSSVVASGATIINELQQLQLAQQHGQRSRLVNLNLVTNGIRSIIDQLNQELAHLKTVLGQRRMVLLNEDATKMANNFSNKCHQLQAWLSSQVKSFLLANNLVPCNMNELPSIRNLSESHEQLRLAVQSKTLEVEALLRSLPTLTENFDAKSPVADDIQRQTDELRHDWIESTNCLDKRLELIRKYLAILDTVSVLNKELESLEMFNSGRPTIPVERTDEDIRANVEQSFMQLQNQVRNFQLDVQKAGTTTELLYPAGPNSPGSATRMLANDMNKQQLVDHSQELLDSFASRKRIANEPATGSAAARPAQREPPASQRPQQVDPPRFTRVLADKTAEPFSTVELECETDQDGCQVDWFMNNFKRIPPSIRHSISSEANHHKLTISSFSPVCCGTYIVRASNGSGQAVSQCRVRLLGIKEAQDEPATSLNPNASLWRQHETSSQQQQQHRTNFQTPPSPAVSTTSSFSQWRPGRAPQVNGNSTTNENNSATTTTTTTTKISRIIQGVDSGSPTLTRAAQSGRDSATSDTTNGTSSVLGRDSDRLPVTQNTYSGPASNNGGLPYSVESPGGSSTTLHSRSVSKSPYEGSPQPPVFVKGLTATMARSSSRAGLVCLVMGNPPPTIEWLHNNQTIATTKCPPRAGATGCPAKGSICKLTIKTMNTQTQGQYVCRATNRAGQTSTALTLSK